MGGLAFELHAFASNDHLFNFYKMWCPPTPSLQSIGEHFNTYRLSTCGNTVQGLITFDLIYKIFLIKTLHNCLYFQDFEIPELYLWSHVTQTQLQKY